MITYTDYGSVLSIDGKSIPKDEKSVEYRMVLEQVAAGKAQVVAYVIPQVPDSEKIKQDLSVNFSLWDFVDAYYSNRNGDATKDNAIYAKWKEIIGKYPQK